MSFSISKKHLKKGSMSKDSITRDLIQVTKYWLDSGMIMHVYLPQGYTI